MRGVRLRKYRLPKNRRAKRRMKRALRIAARDMLRELDRKLTEALYKGSHCGDGLLSIIGRYY